MSATIRYEQPQPLIKRIAVINRVSEKIQRYDSDNLYPQRALSVLESSSSLSSLLKRVRDFVYGEGFQDESIGKLIVNNQGYTGQTLNKVLDQVCKNVVEFNTPVLHFGYNSLGAISSITSIDFDTIRFYNEDEKLVHSPDWTRSNAELQMTCVYDTFNPDPQIVLEQIEKAGGIDKYKGQILYLTPKYLCYPLSTFDSVYHDAQTQNEISHFKLGSTQNQFLATLAIIYPGIFQTNEDKEAFNELIRAKSGSRKAGGVIGIQDQTGTKKASDIFQVLSPANLDKLYEYTESSIKENIRESEGFPSILLGVTPNGLFAQGDIEEAYTYANSITRKRRMAISELFSYILKFWETPIQSDCKIKELRYLTDDVVGSGNNLNINDNLKNMTGMQAIQFERILRKYENGKYSRQIAEQMLRGGFGLGLDEIAKILDGIDELNKEEATAQTLSANRKKLIVDYL